MLANTITCSRLLFTFIVIGMFGKHNTLNFLLIGAIAFIFVLDAMDGIVARRRNETSEVGATLDTIADRIIENTFWIYFTVMGLIPLWMPIIIMTRGFLTDGLRRYIPPRTGNCASVLTDSRASRGLYGGIKMFTFMSLASTRVSNGFPVLEQVSLSLASITLAFCLLRALPTVIDIYRIAGKRESNAKRFHPVSQSTERLTRKPSIPQKTVR